VLIEGGESRAEAGKFVADHVRQAGLTMPNGKPILPGQVLRWRDEIGSTASELAESTYRDICTKYAKAPRDAMADKARRREIIQGSLIAIWSMGF